MPHEYTNEGHVRELIAKGIIRDTRFRSVIRCQTVANKPVVDSKEGDAPLRPRRDESQSGSDATNAETKRE